MPGRWLRRSRGRLLTSGNGDLRRDGIYTWSLPALAARLPDGRTVKTCPAAGACARLCYARTGTYEFPDVKAAHARNLARVVDDLPGWERQMMTELQAARYRPREQPGQIAGLLDPAALTGWQSVWLASGGCSVRVHDSGDFLSPAYMDAWLRVAAAAPYVLFYAYTKQIRWAKARRLPPNFVFIYSTGGTEDDLIDLDRDRHAEVFPDDAALAAAGYVDQAASDLLAALMPEIRVGIVANNHPHLLRRQAGRSFGQIQQEQTERKESRL